MHSAVEGHDAVGIMLPTLDYALQVTSPYLAGRQPKRRSFRLITVQQETSFNVAVGSIWNRQRWKLTVIGGQRGGCLQGADHQQEQRGVTQGALQGSCRWRTGSRYITSQASGTLHQKNDVKRATETVMRRSITFGFAAIAALSGCVQLDSRSVDDASRDASWAARVGLGQIEGQFVKGETQGAGEPVWLLPSVKSTDVWLTSQLQEGGQSLNFHELDESVRPFVKVSIADSRGRFHFDHLPGGSWTVIGCMLSQASSTALPKRICMHTQVSLPEAGEKTVSLSQ